VKSEVFLIVVNSSDRHIRADLWSITALTQYCFRSYSEKVSRNVTLMCVTCRKCIH